jgi:hypothetical protein
MAHNMDTEVSMDAFNPRRRALTLSLAAGWMVGSWKSPMAQAVENHRFSNSSGSENAALKAPPSACDAHVYIYDDRFPIVNPAAAPASGDRRRLFADPEAARHDANGHCPAHELWNRQPRHLGRDRETRAG